MKPLWTVLILMASSLPLLADVSKEEIRRLLDAHVSDQTLITYVQKNGPMQPLTVEDLSELKNAGASDEVLRALLEATHPSDAITPPPASSESYPSDTTSTVIGPSSSYSYDYYPYYMPYTIYPSFFYCSPYYTPYRYSAYPYYPYYRSYYYGRPYPYSSYYYGRHYPVHTTIPRVPVQPRSVHPYRPAPTPHLPPPSQPRPAPQQGQHPGGHVRYR